MLLFLVRVSFIIMKELKNQSSFLNLFPTPEPAGELVVFWTCRTAAAFRCACVGLQQHRGICIVLCVSLGLSYLCYLWNPSWKEPASSPLQPCWTDLKTKLCRFYYPHFCLVFVFLPTFVTVELNTTLLMHLTATSTLRCVLGSLSWGCQGN